MKNENGDQLKMSQIRMVEFQKGADIYRYKVNYSGEWMSAKIKTARLGNKKKDIKMKQAYTSKIPLSERKKNDLLKLLKSNTVPKYYENYYNSLF